MEYSKICWVSRHRPFEPIFHAQERCTWHGARTVHKISGSLQHSGGHGKIKLCPWWRKRCPVLHLPCWWTAEQEVKIIHSILTRANHETNKLRRCQATIVSHWQHSGGSDVIHRCSAQGPEFQDVDSVPLNCLTGWCFHSGTIKSLDELYIISNLETTGCAEEMLVSHHRSEGTPQAEGWIWWRWQGKEIEHYGCRGVKTKLVILGPWQLDKSLSIFQKKKIVYIQRATVNNILLAIDITWSEHIDCDIIIINI